MYPPPFPAAGPPSQYGAPTFNPLPPAPLPSLNGGPPSGLGTAAMAAPVLNASAVSQFQQMPQQMHHARHEEMARHMAGVQQMMAQQVFAPSPADKLTTVFVGSITDGVADSWMERILRTCGLVRNWKRVTDSNGRPKGFGFCIYDSAESVLRALRVLGGEGSTTGGLEVPAPGASTPPKRLNLKVDAVARRHIDDYRIIRGDQSGADGPARAEVTRVIEAMASDQADSFLNSIIPAGMDTGLPIDTGGPRNPMDDLPEEMPAEEREKVSREISLFRERAAAKDREKRERESEEKRRQEDRERERRAKMNTPPGAGVDAPGGHGHQNGGGGGFRERDRERERDRPPFRYEEVDEEEEARRQERRERELAQAYAERESRYMMRETQRLRVLMTNQQKQQDWEQKRERDREGMKRRLEEWDDEVEKARGLEEFYTDRPRWLARRRQFLHREMEMDERDRKAEEEELARRMPELERQEEERRRQEAERAERIARDRAEEIRAHEESQKKAQQENAKTDGGAAEAGGVVVSRIMTMEERKQAIQKMVAAIPTDLDGLCGWEVRWDFLDNNVIKDKLEPFISNKVTEYLQAEDKDLVEFVVNKIRKRMGARHIIEELQEALDDEAEIFVMKLWRKVIYESEARWAGLS
ncbi:hypothetical protein HK101_006244 [Irineochytrium annulatum]|nr:hypothetical protein HK101_006244 [Irineochytrium annulatum]